MDKANIITKIDSWIVAHRLWHPLIGPILRNELLSSACFLIIGISLAPFFTHVFWFGVGNLVMAMTFLGLLRMFVNISGIYEKKGIIFFVIFRWTARLLLTGIFLYLFIVYLHANVLSLSLGLLFGLVLAILTHFLISAK